MYCVSLAGNPLKRLQRQKAHLYIAKWYNLVLQFGNLSDDKLGPSPPRKW